MLDKKVRSMIDDLRSEIEVAETSIGSALHKLDLDDDGILSHDEIVQV